MLERLFRERRYRVNFHAHSTYSDGSSSPRDASPRIIPGVEVKVQEGGVDVLLYAEREKLIAFFHDVVEPALDPFDPLYGAARLKILELVGSAHEAGMWMVIPHYYHNEGLSVLLESLQREVAKFPVAIELNALLSRSANGAAKTFARAVHRPLIAAADSHRPDQYLAAYTSIPLPFCGSISGQEGNALRQVALACLPAGRLARQSEPVGLRSRSLAKRT
ncbi:hypothetical protein HYT95_03745 [Candidatus Peregrinibacteria bacterium]|nr:hypothetical protein [Candidatus Peregrinibacteria bacterium]